MVVDLNGPDVWLVLLQRLQRHLETTTEGAKTPPSRKMRSNDCSRHKDVRGLDQYDDAACSERATSKSVSEEESGCNLSPRLRFGLV